VSLSLRGSRKDNLHHFAVEQAKGEVWQHFPGKLAKRFPPYVLVEGNNGFLKQITLKEIVVSMNEPLATLVKDDTSLNTTVGPVGDFLRFFSVRGSQRFGKLKLLGQELAKEFPILLYSDAHYSFYLYIFSLRNNRAKNFLLEVRKADAVFPLFTRLSMQQNLGAKFNVTHDISFKSDDWAPKIEHNRILNKLNNVVNAVPFLKGITIEFPSLDKK
jgi:hypothetical protein